MGDFLTRMAERALDPAREVRPDLAPGFSFAPFEPASSREESPTGPAYRAHADRPSSMISAGDNRRADLRGEADGFPHSSHAAIARVQPESLQPGERLSSFRSRHAEPSIASDLRRNAEPRESATLSHVSDDHDSEHLPRIEAAPPGNVERNSSLPREGSSPPTIRVTIGRIDVRAVTAPTPVQPRSEGAPRRLRTLDDYLRTRNGERS